MSAYQTASITNRAVPSKMRIRVWNDNENLHHRRHVRDAQVGLEQHLARLFSSGLSRMKPDPF